MTSQDACSAQLGDVVLEFNRRGAIEAGLDVEEDALIQLRKACRILDGVRSLREIGDHYTLIVEGSFAAIERTVQFYVVNVGKASSDEITSHADTFALGEEAGVFSPSTANELTELWRNYRNGTYYQQERATKEQAEAMFQYATRLHEHISRLARRRHDCIC